MLTLEANEIFFANLLIDENFSQQDNEKQTWKILELR